MNNKFVLCSSELGVCNINIIAARDWLYNSDIRRATPPSSFPEIRKYWM